MQDRIDSLRRAVQYGREYGKKNIIVDLDVLEALFAGNVPVGGNVLPPEEVTARLYAIKEQRDKLFHVCVAAVGFLAGASILTSDQMKKRLADVVKSSMAEVPA